MGFDFPHPHMKRISGKKNGFIIESKKGWFYLSINSKAYRIHLAFGRLVITFGRRGV